MYSIETSKLTKKYKNKIAVDGINLQIKKEQIIDGVAHLVDTY